MNKHEDKANSRYYISRKVRLLKEFYEESGTWQPVLIKDFGADCAHVILKDAGLMFEGLIPRIPYIGGDENHLTGELVSSTWSLALYQAMKKNGKTAEDTGRILYDSVLANRYLYRPPIHHSNKLTYEQSLERRRTRAEKSQERCYSGDYVYELVIGDGVDFDYGYDFSECAAWKFYHTMDADEFMPYYCYLDFPKNANSGEGFSRTMTLVEGFPKCNHRIKLGGNTRLGWPPPFSR